MAGESSTVAIEPKNHVHEFKVTTYGPFSHAAGSGALALGAGANVPIGDVFDRDTIIDAVHGITEGGAGSARTVRLAYATNGQDPASAVTASQFITAAADLWFDTNPSANLFEFVIDRTKNFVPAGARLFLVLGASGDTNLSGFRLRIRQRTLIR